jgi:restriction endonuclease Mrr
LATNCPNPLTENGRTAAHGLMIEHSVGGRLNRAVEFKKLDEDYFDEED